MNDADRRIAEIAAGQRQVFTRAQTRHAGLTFNAIRRRLDSGLFVVVGSRTLVFAGTILDWRGQLQAGLLDLGEGSLVSAEAAAAIHGFDGFDEGPLVYLVPREMKDRTTNGAVTSTTSITGLDRVRVDGLPVTSGTRTVIELIGRVGVSELGNGLDSACRMGLTAPHVVTRRLSQLGRSGRTGVSEFDEVMNLCGVQSWLERAFLRLVRRSGIPVPQVQRTYRRDGVHVARVDFDFAPADVVVEVGGKRGYMSAGERQRKERRRNEMQLLGKLIYFFSTEDVRDDPSYVVRVMREALGSIAS